MTSALGLGNAHYFKDMPNPKLDEVKKLLSGSAETTKLEGMKRLIAVRVRAPEAPRLLARLLARECVLPPRRYHRLLRLRRSPIRDGHLLLDRSLSFARYLVGSRSSNLARATTAQFHRRRSICA